MRGINAPRPPNKSPDINKKRSDNRKQWSCPDKLFCPAASCGPCEVKGLSYLGSSNNSRALVKKDRNLSSPDCQGLHELSRKETNVRASLTLQGGAPQSQRLPQHPEELLQKDVSSENVLQRNEHDVDELQTSASELQTDVCSVEDLQKSPCCAGELQKKACSSRKLKRKEDYEKALIHLPTIVHQNQRFLQKNVSSTRRSTKMEKCDEPWSLTPWVEHDSEEESIEEEVTCVEEQKKREIKEYESFQASARQNVRLPKTGPPRLSHLQTTRYSIKQLKSSVLPFPLLGEKA